MHFEARKKQGTKVGGWILREYIPSRFLSHLIVYKLEQIIKKVQDKDINKVKQSKLDKISQNLLLFPVLLLNLTMLKTNFH